MTVSCLRVYASCERVRIYLCTPISGYPSLFLSPFVRETRDKERVLIETE